MTSKKTLSASELDLLISELLKQFAPQTIVLLEGTLGSGKTFLVNKILSHLGELKAGSPTYALIHQYKTVQYENIFHVDLYRLQSKEDLESTGFWDIFENKKALVFIEWSRKIDFDDLPMSWKKIKIDIKKSKDEAKREYFISKVV